MRMGWSCAVCFLALLCSTASAFGQQLDIIMEGPWIYYVDTQFTGGTALIAMAPNTSSHHWPTFSTGHGKAFPSQPMIYCVGYGANCASPLPPSTSTPPPTMLPNGNYPGLHLVPVTTPSPSTWKWYQWSTTEQKSAFYLILPWPDSASNYAVDNMMLENNFGVPTTDASYSIGTQLHYRNWPSKNITLFSCDTPASSDSCGHPQPVIPQDQNGTLRIAMSPMEEADPNGPSSVCEYHIRSAYHSMILLLDDTSLESTGTPNANHDKGYIDLRRTDTDAYDDTPYCLYCDPQNPTSTCPVTQMVLNYTPMDSKVLLRNIVALFDGPLKTISSEEHGLMAPQLRNELAKEWDGKDRKDLLPEPSQFQRTEGLLEQSFPNAQKLYKQILDEERLHQAAQMSSLARSLEQLLDAERELIVYFKPHPFNATTSGKDCRAAQMQIQ